VKKKTCIYLFAFVLLLVDQISKFVIVQVLDFQESISIIPSFFDLYYVQNEGGAWGLFSSATWLITFVSFVFLLLFHQYLSHKRSIDRLSFFAYSLLLGGILGNLLDRVIYQYVIDFLSFHFGSYAFPVFNLADIFIVMGMILLIIHILKEEYNERYCDKK